MAAISLAAWVIIAVVAYRSWPSKPSPTALSIPLWYYDLASNRLLRNPDHLSPVNVGGHELVKAYVFSCTECQEAESRYIGFLERISPEGQAALKTQFKVETYSGPAGIDRFELDMLKDKLPPNAIQVRDVQKEGWVDTFSPEGVKLRAKATTRCAEEQTMVDCDHSDF